MATIIKNASWVLALFLCSGMATQASGLPKNSVQFTLLRDSIIVVPVMINGRGPYQFVLDTGSESTEVDRSLGAELKMQSADRVLLFTPTGHTTAARVYADEIAIGPARTAHTELLVDNLDTLHQVSPSIQGILGQNFLTHFDYLLNYRHSRLEFMPEQDVAMAALQSRTPVVRQHGRLILTGRTVQKDNLRLALDSGSSALILYRSDLRRSMHCSVAICSAEVRSSLGTKTVDIGTFPTIELDGASLHDLPAAFIWNSEADVDGLLPTNLFSAVFFNNRESYVVLTPKNFAR